MFALRHYLVIEADSFPRVSLSGNCLHLGTDNVRGKYPCIFSRQIEAIFYIFPK